MGEERRERLPAVLLRVEVLRSNAERVSQVLHDTRQESRQ